MTGALTIPSRPLVSIVMPVYDSGAYLEESLRSIQAQSYRRWELIVVDDGSSDDSVAIARALACRDARIRVIELARGGVARALNTGVGLAQGELIARMDADDIAVPERLEVELGWMRRTGVEVCGSCAMWFGDHTGLWWVPEHHDTIALELVMTPSMVHPSILMHAEIARANPYREDCTSEDFELWTRLIGRHRFGNVPIVLLRYRRHLRQVTLMESERIKVDANACRRARFDAIFPDAAPALVRAFHRVSRIEPCSDLEELEHAGTMLSRLAESPERQHRMNALSRWVAVCRRSTHLGLPAYRTYTRFAPAFKVPAPEPDAVRALHAACAVRLRWGSPWRQRLRGVLPTLSSDRASA